MNRMPLSSRPFFMFALLLGSLAGPAAAVAAELPDVQGQNPRYWSVQLENDFFANSGDRYYTHGTQVSMLERAEPPGWLAGMANWAPLFRAGDGLRLVNYTVGQKIFTPEDIEAGVPPSDDRPYAGYLYASAALLARIEGNAYFDYGNLFEVTLGLIGPSALGDEVQSGFHEIIGSEIAQGWDKQLHDELGFGLAYSQFWRLVQPLNDDWQIGMNPHVSLMLGNVYTYAAGGVMLRLGQHLKKDLAPPTIRPGFPGLSYFQPSPGLRWYLFAGYESRLVLRDIFLDGNSFDDESPSVEKERLVGDIQFGVVFFYGKLRIAFSNMIRSKEFETQSDNTQYGALNFSFFN